MAISAAKKVKQPITKGIAKVPVIMQLEALECGAACRYLNGCGQKA